MRKAKFGKNHELTDEQLEAIGATLGKTLNLKKDREHPDRWVTGWGTKTNIGLSLTILEMACRINNTGRLI